MNLENIYNYIYSVIERQFELFKRKIANSPIDCNDIYKLLKEEITFLKKKLKPLEFTGYLDVNRSVCELYDYLTWVKVCIKKPIWSQFLDDIK